MHHEDQEVLWTHGIDESQNDIIEKAVRQYTKNTGYTISKQGMLKKILFQFHEDMDIVYAGMPYQDRKAACGKEAAR